MLLVLVTVASLTITISCTEYTIDSNLSKRALQKSHEIPRIQKLSNLFLEPDFYSEYPSDSSLINLLSKIAMDYLYDCTTAILYDNYTNTQDHVFLRKFFQQYPLTHVHAAIPENYHIPIGELAFQLDNKCVHFIIFIKDVMLCQDIISKRSEKVVVVAKSSQWRVQEYLTSEFSREIANLLIIVKSEKYMSQKVRVYNNCQQSTFN